MAKKAGRQAEADIGAMSDQEFLEHVESIDSISANLRKKYEARLACMQQSYSRAAERVMRLTSREDRPTDTHF